MSAELIVGWVALLVAVIGVAVSLWAIWDVRKQVKELITLERKLLYTRLRNDLVWQFVEPIQSVHPREIAKGLEEFAIISQALNPAHTAELTKHAVENETLVFAKKLVDSGYARFKSEWDEKKIREMIRSWQNSINANRVAEILGEQQDGTPFTKG